MPSYDYECTQCSHRFEAFQSMSDEPLLECPACNRDTLRRLISGGTGIIFRGSGFYVTDSKSGNKSKAAKAPAADASASTGEAKTGGSTDTAGAATTTEAPKAPAAGAPAGGSDTPAGGKPTQRKAG